MLFITGTHISVPALTGSIMTMGVATANSILVISFAREQMEENAGDAHAAALSAGYTRFRPVLMTALAMIIGMIPMAIGLGEGGEQNAPLGRAVIGGLSLGGYMSLAFWLAHPERVAALVLCDTGPGYRRDEARQEWNDNAAAPKNTLSA